MKTDLKKTLISEKWLVKLRRLSRYNLVFFLAFVAIIYSIVFLHISSLNNAQPSEAAVNNQVQAAKLPDINPKTIQQIEALRDNSVSVQSLFDKARSNPFQ